MVKWIETIHRPFSQKKVHFFNFGSNFYHSRDRIVSIREKLQNLVATRNKETRCFTHKNVPSHARHLSRNEVQWRNKYRIQLSSPNSQEAQARNLQFLYLLSLLHDRLLIYQAGDLGKQAAGITRKLERLGRQGRSSRINPLNRPPFFFSRG